MIGETINVTLKDGEVLEVSNVLIEPKEQSDIQQNASYNTPIAYTLHFPKNCECLRKLEGARAEVRGKRYRVLGTPKPYTLTNTPTFWIMPVDVAFANYDTPITIQRAKTTQNDKGDSITEWKDVLSTHALVVSISGEEEVKGASVNDVSKRCFEFDYDKVIDDIDPTNARIKCEGKIYDLFDVENVNFACDIVRAKGKLS